MDQLLRLAVDPPSRQIANDTAPASACAVGMTTNERDSLATGHAGIDNDHRFLFGLVDDYQRAVEDARGDAAVGQLLCDLATYAAGHFEREEALMRRLRFPEAEAHRAEHDGFLASLGDLVAAYEIGCPAVPGDTLSFLRRWMTDHLIGWDCRLVAFLNAQRIRRRAAP